ncbi:hypothetical protein M378DRAFT_18342 [Amanita muscaria Koide BX008]|uniref:Uncharacterized protein n=1 Tax=Amanita muscaria (strain Koide BX008) TaxID=946122 RepID=A0A0C2W1K3_AMAMK|nr:hypothetical protein M378DRAFT_18342 [Amanita muscaria Koide BX008]
MTLDPDRDDLPIKRAAELMGMCAELRPRKGKAREVLDKTEPRDAEATELLENKEAPKQTEDAVKCPDIKGVLLVFAELYDEDQFFSQIWKNPDRHGRFEKKRDLLWTKN